MALAKAMIKAGKKAAKSPDGGLFSGIASVYGFETGSRTASGRPLKLAALTAAHRTLPFGTNVLVTNKRNGKTVTVVINDRGPFVKGRVIDVDARRREGALGFFRPDGGVAVGREERAEEDQGSRDLAVPSPSIARSAQRDEAIPVRCAHLTGIASLRSQ